MKCKNCAFGKKKLRRKDKNAENILFELEIYSVGEKNGSLQLFVNCKLCTKL